MNRRLMIVSALFLAWGPGGARAEEVLAGAPHTKPARAPVAFLASPAAAAAIRRSGMEPMGMGR